MPCSDRGQAEYENAAEISRLKRALDRATRAACEAYQRLEQLAGQQTSEAAQQVANHALGGISHESKDWYAEHVAADRFERARAAKARKQKNEERMRRAGELRAQAEKLELEAGDEESGS